MRDDPVVTDLVTTAGNGGKQAWDALVERYAPLVWSICRRHQLGDTDAENVGQIVWLQLLDHLSSVPHPAALPGWLATTTRRECRCFCAPLPATAPGSMLRRSALLASISDDMTARLWR